MRLLKQISVLLLVVVLFAAFNLGMYMLLTCRLANNFSGATQAKMVDVEAYLPHRAESDLVRIESSLRLTDN